MRVVLLALLLSHKGLKTRRWWQHRAVFLSRNVVKAKNLRFFSRYGPCSEISLFALREPQDERGRHRSW